MNAWQTFKQLQTTLQASVWPDSALTVFAPSSVVIVGGLVVLQLGPEKIPPEIDPLHHAPRVKVPVLMLNGRHDPIFAYETSQLPLLRTLGTAEADKRHVTFPAGHSSSSWQDDLIRESLDWLDRYFGRP